VGLDTPSTHLPPRSKVVKHFPPLAPIRDLFLASPHHSSPQVFCSLTTQDLALCSYGLVVVFSAAARQELPPPTTQGSRPTVRLLSEHSGERILRKGWIIGIRNLANDF
jgi:hypothetical protein